MRRFTENPNAKYGQDILIPLMFVSLEFVLMMSVLSPRRCSSGVTSRVRPRLAASPRGLAALPLWSELVRGGLQFGFSLRFGALFAKSELLSSV